LQIQTRAHATARSYLLVSLLVLHMLCRGRCLRLALVQQRTQLVLCAALQLHSERVRLRRRRGPAAAVPRLRCTRAARKRRRALRAPLRCGLLHAEEQLCRTSPQHLSDSLTKPYFVCVKLHRAKFALQTWTLARTYPGKALARAQPDAQRSPAREGEKESAGLPGEWPWSPSPRRSARPQRKQRRVRSSAALRELRGSRWRTAPTATPQRQGPMQLARRLRTLATAPTRPSAQ